MTVHLDVIQVAEPCTVDWNAMKGSDQVRFCGQCRMNVYNLSEMVRTDAEQLVERAEGRLCIRFYRRADGTVTTKDCAPIRFAAARKAARRALIRGAALAAVVVAAVGTLGWYRLSPDAVGCRIRQVPVVGELLEQVYPEERAMMGEAPMMESPPVQGGVTRMGRVASPH